MLTNSLGKHQNKIQISALLKLLQLSQCYIPFIYIMLEIDNLARGRLMKYLSYFFTFPTYLGPVLTSLFALCT